MEDIQNITTIDQFLNYYRIKKDDEISEHAKPTHVSLSGGSYHIPDERLIQLHRLISSAYPRILNIAECHPDDYSCICIDFDFKRNEIPQTCVGKNRHIFDSTFIENVIELYIISLIDMGVNPKSGYNAFSSFVFYRSSGYMNKNNIYKDGFHILFPSIGLSYPNQYELRRRVVKDLKTDKWNVAWDSIATINTIDDVVDESVIQRNAWILFGNSKPNLEPYKLISAYDYNGTETGLIKQQIPLTIPLYQLITGFSIRRVFKDVDKGSKCIFYDIKSSSIEPYKDQESTWEKLIPPTIKNSSSECKVNLNISAKYPNIEKALTSLPVEFLTDRTKWLRIAYALKSVFVGETGFLLFDNWSKTSSSYGGTRELWNSLKTSVIPISYIYLSSLNNDEFIGDIYDNEFQSLIINSSFNDEGYAGIFNYLFDKYFSDRILEYDIGNGIWHYFNNSWQSFKSKDVSFLLSCFNDTCEIIKINIKYCAKIYSDKKDKELLKTLLTCYGKVLLTFGDVVKVGKSCKFLTMTKYYGKSENIDELFDKNFRLVKFMNGIYDLDTKLIRPELASDRIKKCVRCNYGNKFICDTYYDFNTGEILTQILIFLRNVFPTDSDGQDAYNYYYNLLSKILDKRFAIKRQKMIVMLGKGANAKSETMACIEEVLGRDIFLTSDNAVFTGTNKNITSGGTDTGLLDLKGAYGICMSEIGTGEKDNAINTEKYKKFLGGDNLTARGLFQTTQNRFRNQALVFYLSNNIPIFDSPIDHAILRRISFLNFPNTFVDIADFDPKNPKHRLIDTTISDQIKNNQKYKDILITYLVDTFLHVDLIEPKCVTKYTKDMKKEMNTYVGFFEMCITENIETGHGITAEEIWDRFKAYLKTELDLTSDYITKKFKRKDLLDKVFDKFVIDEKSDYKLKHADNRNKVFLKLSLL